MKHTLQVAVATLAMALAGCSGSSPTPNAEPPTRSPQTTPTATAVPSQTTSPVPTDPQEAAVMQAEAAVKRYYQVLDRLVQEPAADTSELKDVAISTGESETLDTIESVRRVGRQVGDRKIANMTSQVLNLEYRPTEQPPVIPVVSVEVCYDVSALDVLDATGKSLLPADRPTTGLERLQVANYSWPDPHGWKVSSTITRGEPCSSGG